MDAAGGTAFHQRRALAPVGKFSRADSAVDFVFQSESIPLVHSNLAHAD